MNVNRTHATPRSLGPSRSQGPAQPASGVQAPPAPAPCQPDAFSPSQANHGNHVIPKNLMGPQAGPQHWQKPGNFAQTVQANFKKWDTDGDGTLSSTELQQQMVNPSNKGKNAAALAEVYGLVSGKHSTGPISMKGIQKYEKSGKAEPQFQKFQQKLQQAAANPSLFGPNGPQASDINQGKIGDCWALSTLAAQATTDPASIQKMIQKNQNGSYTVNLPGGAQTVSAPTPAELALGNSSQGHGIWANVMEKALGQYVGQTEPNKASIEPLAAMGPSQATVAMQALTGQPAARDALHATNGSPAVNFHQEALKIQQALASGQSVVASALKPSDGLPGHHAYTVASFDPHTHSVTIRNPWGKMPTSGLKGINDLGGGNFTMSVKDFFANYNSLNFSQVPV